MTELRNHPGHNLNSAAEASLARFEAKHGLVTITRAGVSPAYQNELIRRYYVVGGKRNRPPYLYPPLRPAEKSKHVANGGEAIDTPDYARMAKHGADFGWIQILPKTDKVHLEYFPAKDKFRNQAPAGSAAGGSPRMKREQAFLNQYRGEKLKTDGVLGDATKNAVKRYQAFLRKNYGYVGAADGLWGNGTQAAHAKYYAAITKSQAKPVVKGFSQAVKDRQGFLILKRGEKLNHDGLLGPATKAAIARYQTFLRKNYGYRGTSDGIWGSGTQAAHAKYYAKVK
jgi:peptidoglycan hydrolase-like protein with peptidoglycan-binding domain